MVSAVTAILRVVEQETAVFNRELVGASRIVGEQIPQVERLHVAVVVLQAFPFRGLVETRHD